MSSTLSVFPLETSSLRLGAQDAVRLLDFNSSPSDSLSSHLDYGTHTHTWSTKPLACAAVLVFSVGITPVVDTPVSLRLPATALSTDAARLKRSDEGDDKVSSLGYVDNVEGMSSGSAMPSRAIEAHGKQVEDAMTAFNNEWLPKERVLKATINGTFLFCVVLSSIFLSLGLSSGWFLALVPGVISAFGVVGSCAIQLNKIEALRDVADTERKPVDS